MTPLTKLNEKIRLIFNPDNYWIVNDVRNASIGWYQAPTDYFQFLFQFSS